MLMRIIFVISACAMALVFIPPLVAIEFFSQKAEYSFRLTIKVDVDGELKEGSSVIHVAHRTPPQWVGAVFNSEVWVSGDAVFVDLGRSGNLVAALVLGPKGTNGEISYLVPRMLHPFSADEHGKSTLTAPRPGSKAEVKGNNIPTLVTFRDVHDPDTARLVPPQDFPAVFGQGVAFRGAWVEITDAPVTRGLDEKLPLVQLLRERSRMITAEPPGFHPKLYYFSRGDAS
jgi:hypothetical protein